MSGKKIKFLIAGIIIVLSIGYLVFAGFKDSMVYYVTVSELQSKEQQMIGEKVRLGGKVLGGSILKDPETLQVSFTLVQGHASLPISYKGVVPDTFKDDCEVVLEGKYMKDKVFKADQLMAKCPSKYESKYGKKQASQTKDY